MQRRGQILDDVFHVEAEIGGGKVFDFCQRRGARISVEAVFGAIWTQVLRVEF